LHLYVYVYVLCILYHPAHCIGPHGYPTIMLRPRFGDHAIFLFLEEIITIVLGILILCIFRDPARPIFINPYPVYCWGTVGSISRIWQFQRNRNSRFTIRSGLGQRPLTPSSAGTVLVCDAFVVPPGSNSIPQQSIASTWPSWHFESEHKSLHDSDCHLAIG